MDAADLRFARDDPETPPTMDEQIDLHMINIDGAFFELYPPHGLPPLRAGDLIFVALVVAKVACCSRRIGAC